LLPPRGFRSSSASRRAYRLGRLADGNIKTENLMATQPRCTLTATLHARPEKRAELVKLLESFVPASRAEHGCIEYHFHVSDEDPNVFYFYENWTDRAALDVHLNLPYQKEWFGRHDEFLSRKVELRFFTMLSDYDK
jgi:quinol monooxygenase YgiN